MCHKAVKEGIQSDTVRTERTRDHESKEQCCSELIEKPVVCHEAVSGSQVRGHVLRKEEGNTTEKNMHELPERPVVSHKAVKEGIDT